MKKLEKGAITDSGNFKLIKKIESLDELYGVLLNNKSFFARHRMYPTAFFFSWQMKQCMMWLTAGWFWTTEETTQFEKQVAAMGRFGATVEEAKKAMEVLAKI